MPHDARTCPAPDLGNRTGCLCYWQGWREATGTTRWPSCEEKVAERIAEMERLATERYAQRSTTEWRGLENMTLTERRHWIRRVRADWKQHTTPLRGAAA